MALKVFSVGYLDRLVTQAKNMPNYILEMSPKEVAPKKTESGGSE